MITNPQALAAILLALGSPNTQRIPRPRKAPGPVRQGRSRAQRAERRRQAQQRAKNPHRKHSQHGKEKPR